jgi:hypothetical protein
VTMGGRDENERLETSGEEKESEASSSEGFVGVPLEVVTGQHRYPR